MDLIVHLGFHKTGSTAIQESLASGLEDPLWCYVALGRPNGSLAIRQAFDEGFAKGPRRANVRTRGRRTIEMALSEAAAPNGILSAESLSSLSAADLRTACDFLKGRVGSIRAVGYIRPVKSYFESAFQEVLKNNLPGPGTFRFAFHKTIDRIDATFGRENTTLLKYAREALQDGCVVQDFCGRIGVAFDKAAVRNTNTALSREAVSLLYIYRTRHPAPQEGDERIVAVLGDLAGPRFALHSTLFSALSTVGPAEIEAVAERIGQPFDEDLTRHDAEAIRRLDDLRQPSAAALDWLAARVGVAQSSLAGSEDAVAGAVRALAANG